MDSIRSKYQIYGVERFYKSYVDDYENPHEPIIHESIRFVNDNWDVDFSSCLDLACGTGEVTMALVELGHERVDACDAYSRKAFELRTKRKCNVVSFDDIMSGMLNGERYSTVVCSFTLHLLEMSKLPTFLYKLTEISSQLLILTPHKRPKIKEEWGWALKNETIISRVRTRLYDNVFYDIKTLTNERKKMYDV